MPAEPSELEKQVEAAYDYRGHVTIVLRSGERIEGFVYNREFANPLAKEDRYIDVMVKDSEERRRIKIADLDRLELTGEDCAAGKSYEDYLKKRKEANDTPGGKCS